MIAAFALALVQTAAAASDPTRPDLSVEQLTDEAVRWLVEHQNKDGSWGSHHSQIARSLETILAWIIESPFTRSAKKRSIRAFLMPKIRRSMATFSPSACS